MASISPHKHCVVCGRAIGEDDSFCDELCESRYKSAQRRQQLLFLVFMLLLLMLLFAPAILNIRA